MNYSLSVITRVILSLYKVSACLSYIEIDCCIALFSKEALESGKKRKRKCEQKKIEKKSIQQRDICLSPHRIILFSANNRFK